MVDQARSSLRHRILAIVGALILISLLGSTISLYRITEVNQTLDAINRVSIPLGRLFAQLQSDADVFRRELDRSLGASHWRDPHWRPRPIPNWIGDLLESEVARVAELIKNESNWASFESKRRWEDWVGRIGQDLKILRADASHLHGVLERRDETAASEIYPKWTASVEEWRRQLQWGSAEYERMLRQTFSRAESRVSELRTGLEVVLAVVVLLSLFMLWLSERALRPLSELTRMARDISRRGLRKEDKALLPEISLNRMDEVSQLGREFHYMATALIEREKALEAQKNRVQEQNRLLREMGELNSNILNSIESVLLVTDLEGMITQCNPEAERWLQSANDKILGTSLHDWPKLKGFVRAFPQKEKWLEWVVNSSEAWRIEPGAVDSRIYGGYLMALRQENQRARGAILVLDDLTEELDLQERLRIAENLAAVGRMSAQVAHEVRNPLHSIGLEAEMAAELSTRLGHLPLRQSLQTILNAVDRLEKITESYLKFSKLSAGEKIDVDLGIILESVLATYASTCEAQGVEVDWRRESGSVLKVWGDPELLEQAIGNLLRNSLQALESFPNTGDRPRVCFTLGSLETGRVWIRVEDNGPGIPEEVKQRLFTPFVTTRAQGTGLGLSFVKKVLDDHGGSVTYLDREGGGACFELTLPSGGVTVSRRVRSEAGVGEVLR